MRTSISMKSISFQNDCVTVLLSSFEWCMALINSETRVYWHTIKINGFQWFFERNLFQHSSHCACASTISIKNPFDKWGVWRELSSLWFLQITFVIWFWDDFQLCRWTECPVGRITIITEYCFFCFFHYVYLQFRFNSCDTCQIVIVFIIMPIMHSRAPRPISISMPKRREWSHEIVK